MLEKMKLRLGALRQRMLPVSAAGRHRGERMEDFARALEREIARAGRTDRCLSVVLFRVRSRRRHPLAAHRLALIVCRRARATDCIGWVDDRNVGVVLPDTPASGAKQFAESVTGIASARMPRPTYLVHDYPCVTCGGNPEACAVCAAQNRMGNGERMQMRQSRRTRKDDDQDHHDGNGNGNGNGQHGNGNGSGNGNGRVHAGDHNGNGNVHGGNGNGDGNGTAHAKPAQATLESQLQQVFLEGLRSELLGQHPVSAGPTRLVEELMIRRLPWWKRAIDVVGGAVGLVLAAPLIVAAALLIKRESPGPALFRQRRAGLGGKPFMIYKLRTMVNDAEQRKAQLAALNEQDGPAFKLQDDPRTTKIGRFLRRTSLDELPQFWNVLKGDMTLVGPRPLPVPESNACAPWQRRRLCVTPGITCIWQIYGRSRVSFSEWIRMDLRYIRKNSLAADLKLLVLTVPAVLMRRGAR